MILVDFNQVIFSTISTQFYRTELSEDLLRHMTLNCLRSYKQKFSKKYGELVICVDSRRYWRREIFPFYKSHRKATRESSNLDWTLIFASMDKIKQEIRENFPYKYIEVDGAEADDIIASLALKYSRELFDNQEILILSGDKDFVQLHAPNIKQYDPVQKKWKSVDDVQTYLHEHIIRGDKGDGIPNIKSPDNSLALGQRQGTITKKFIDSFELNTASEELARNYMRNKQLIDLTNIPNDITNKIIAQFETQEVSGRHKLFDYFVKHNLKNLMTNLQDF